MSESLPGEKPSITVMGMGGAGCNTLNRLIEVGSEEIRTLAVHTESVHLKSVLVPTKLLVGETTTKGYGSGGNPVLGERAVEEDSDKLLNAIGRPSVLIVTGGLGGGTASGGIGQLMREIRNRNPELVRVALVTFPFSWEGANKVNNARYGLTRILEMADLTIVNMNDLLQSRIGTIQIEYAFKYMDSLLVNTIKGMTNLFTKPNQVSISFADFVAVSKDAGLGVVGHGTGAKVGEASQTSIKNMLLDASIQKAESALVYVEADPQTTLTEAGEAPQLLTKEYGLPRVFWGLRIDKTLSKPRIMTVATGMTSPTLEEVLGRSF